MEAWRKEGVGGRSREKEKRQKRYEGEKQGKMAVELSDCCGKAYPVVATVKLCVVASNEVCSQNPDGACRGRHIQAPEGDGAHIPFKLGLLETHRTG